MAYRGGVDVNIRCDTRITRVRAHGLLRVVYLGVCVFEVYFELYILLVISVASQLDSTWSFWTVPLLMLRSVRRLVYTYTILTVLAKLKFVGPIGPDVGPNVGTKRKSYVLRRRRRCPQEDADGDGLEDRPVGTVQLPPVLRGDAHDDVVVGVAREHVVILVLFEHGELANSRIPWW